MKLYGQITKIEPLDDGAIRVTGVASTGAIDDAEEQVLPEAMKAALPAYMRFGALREMHGLSAAGSTLSAQVSDDGATRIEALVVDPVAVRKVQAGVYNTKLDGLDRLVMRETEAIRHSLRVLEARSLEPAPSRSRRSPGG